MKQFFLPAGLISAIFFALISPTCGIFIARNNGLNFFVFIIFMISGYQAGNKGISLGRRLCFLLPVAAATSLFLSPLLGLLITKLIPFPQSLALGLIIIAAVPPTLSSGVVITEVSRGNGVLALLLTISLNLAGIFTVPFMLALCLSAAGPIDIDQNGLLIKMLFLVLLPFVAGKLARTLRRRSRISPNWSYVNSSCVILVVYASFAVSGNELAELGIAQYGLILAAVALLHLLLLLINAQAGKLLSLPPADRKALLFVASQKTLPISLAVLTTIQYDIGSAIIVCLFYHFFQLIADSLLAAFLHKKAL